MAAPQFKEHVPIGRIFLARNNPRHEETETEKEAIARLCDSELVHALARDIVKNGINPLERFALVPTSKKNTGEPSYVVAEGNRRLCALKLLRDPELAPANLRKAFERLSEEWRSQIKTVPAAIFPTFEAVRPWLSRIHNGLQGGIGRKDWNADQKQRFDGGTKNRAALSLLDYAESEKLITPEQRKGTLTTVQRFVGNDVFREVLGFEPGNSDTAARTRPKADFDTFLRRFVADLLGKESVNSRMNKEEIVRYSRTLSAIPGISSSRIEPELLSATPTAQAKDRAANRRKKPRRPEKARHVRYEEEIFQALKSLGNEKLSSLYYSICSVELDQHTPLISVGAWSFFETLTACAGKSDSTSFDSFLSNNKLRTYGFSGELGPMRQAMERIRAYGNSTKHHAIAATFNGDQLNNDMAALKGIIMKAIEEAATRVPSKA